MLYQYRIIYYQLYLFFVCFRLETVKTVLVLIAALMGALTLMIIFIGFLATGATRRRIYKAWRNRVGGRISCAVVSLKMYF